MDTTYRYIVETEFRPGERTVIYRGDNYDTAVEKTNFWDERQNTYLIDLKKRQRQEVLKRENETALEHAHRQFDELAQQMSVQYRDLEIRLSGIRFTASQSYDAIERRLKSNII